MDNLYKARVKKVAEALKTNHSRALVLIDNEAHRDASVRYLSGVTSDCVLVITDKGDSIAVVWDLILAQKTAFATKVEPLSKWGYDDTKVVNALIRDFCRGGSIIEIAPYITFSKYNLLKTRLRGYRLDCSLSVKGAFNQILEMRKEKDETEIATLKKAAEITNDIIDQIESNVKKGKIKTETDAALFIERALREAGGERTGFDTLAAGGARSSMIHAFPNYTAGGWGDKPGLSILDFGIVVDGYTSDVTMTIARGKLSPVQEELVTLVERAYKECLPLYKAGEKMSTPMNRAQEIFMEKNRMMPHTLGHGIGLDIHEAPRVSDKCGESFRKGMVVTLEPGLYDEEAGGVRWENDILITDSAPVVLTKSKIIRF